MKLVGRYASAIALILPMALQATSMQAQPADEKIQQLEQKVEQLDQESKVANRKAELKAEDDAAKAKNGAHVTVDDMGFTILSNDEASSIKIGGDLQIDNRAFYGPALHLGRGRSGGSRRRFQYGQGSV